MFQTENIAILMATYNGADYIKDQIQSLLDQSYQQWDLYIHDDKSSDHTVEIIRNSYERYSPKIHIINGPKAGSAKNNFFYLMKHVSAPYYMFCDQDDVWLESKIKKSIDTIKKAEKTAKKQVPALVFTDLKVVNQSLGVIGERMSKYQQLNPRKIEFKDLLIQNVITGCSSIINKPCAEYSLNYLDDENIIEHDWWCALIAAYFGVIDYIDEPLVLYRQHSQNSIGAKNISDIHYDIQKLFNLHEIRRSLEQTRKQSGEFSKAFNLGKESLAYQYSKLDELNKIERIAFYKNNKMWKSSFVRNVGLIVCG